MSNKETDIDEKDCHVKLACELLTDISKNYWGKMYNSIKENRLNLENVNCFILNPESLVLYFSKKFLAIEYCGNPFKREVKKYSIREISIRDFTKEDIDTKQFLAKIIGFEFDGTSTITLPLLEGMYENLIIPTNAGMDKLIDLKWNFAAQNSFVSLNSQGIDLLDNQFVRLINCSFYDSQNDDLKTRTIKWIDFIPCFYNDSLGGDFDEFSFDLSYFESLWERDMFYQYPQPKDYKYNKLPKVNEFIELFGDKSNSEPDITSFLEREENSFIMSMAFMGVKVYGQLECDWQSELKQKIKPDFFIVRSNGYADIIEFKLPYIKNNVVVGGNNREQFNAQSIMCTLVKTRIREILVMNSFLG